MRVSQDAGGPPSQDFEEPRMSRRNPAGTETGQSFCAPSRLWRGRGAGTGTLYCSPGPRASFGFRQGKRTTPIAYFLPLTTTDWPCARRYCRGVNDDDDDDDDSLSRSDQECAISTLIEETEVQCE